MMIELWDRQQWLNSHDNENKHNDLIIDWIVDSNDNKYETLINEKEDDCVEE